MRRIVSHSREFLFGGLLIVGERERVGLSSLSQSTRAKGFPMDYSVKDRLATAIGNWSELQVLDIAFACAR